MWQRALLVLMFFWGSACQAFDRALEADDELLFFPGIAALASSEESGTRLLCAQVEAWVFKQESHSLLGALAAWQMGLNLATLTRDEQARFRERTRYFRSDSERGIVLRLRFSEAPGHLFELPATNAAGRASQVLTLPATAFGALDRPRPLSFAVDKAGGLRGEVWFAPPEGVSVVSDIDDTVKISEVRNRQALLHNTFIRPFVAAPGMAEWYRQLQADYPAVAFHYVSASPWQLYPALRAFLQKAGFPPGSIHLRESTAWHSLIPEEEEGAVHKHKSLARLFAAYPKRRFILIGDSGESDPEIYAETARAPAAGAENRHPQCHGRGARSAALPASLWRSAPRVVGNQVTGNRGQTLQGVPQGWRVNASQEGDLTLRT